MATVNLSPPDPTTDFLTVTITGIDQATHGDLSRAIHAATMRELEQRASAEAKGQTLARANAALHRSIIGSR